MKIHQDSSAIHHENYCTHLTLPQKYYRRVTIFRILHPFHVLSINQQEEGKASTDGELFQPDPLNCKNQVQRITRSDREFIASPKRENSQNAWPQRSGIRVTIVPAARSERIACSAAATTNFGYSSKQKQLKQTSTDYQVQVKKHGD
jgi:hypothetical protein